ncbi:MAG: 50S ribosomal protein L17 [Candidatus Latescibacteria bacterium]|nr:50S ribosomal protein L17 [Candidatus Latescibacterota bacterium]
MRHAKKVAKLGRTYDHRNHMMANIVTSFFAHESIQTTEARAKELRREAEHVISFAKRGDLHARRQVLRLIADKKVVAKIFSEIAPRYTNRQGGYTRIVKLGNRRGDSASLCLIELVDRPAKEARSAAAKTEGATEKEGGAEDKS